MDRMQIKRNRTHLIVSNDLIFCKDLHNELEKRGYPVEVANDIRFALSHCIDKTMNVVLLDITVCKRKSSFLEALSDLKRICDCEVIVMSASGSIETAVQAMKRGAYDVVSKRICLNRLLKKIEVADRAVEIRKRNRGWYDSALPADPNLGIFGESPCMKEVFRLLRLIGPSDKPVLIQGETGAGKELIARALHRLSSRATQPLVVINCAALPETMLESELFGYEKGAFTGANEAKPGLIEIADGGTFFIDEIGEMPLSMQAKLLRVLEGGWLRRLGSLEEKTVDVRLITATNRRLSQEVAQGRFRQDLFYRLDVLQIELPPLRHREGDIPLLTYLLAGEGWEIEAEALYAICHYQWPGNVRQLRNAIERAKTLAETNTIQLCNLPPEVIRSPFLKDDQCMKSVVACGD